MRIRSRWGSGGLFLLAALASGCGANVTVPIHFEPFQIESSDWSCAWSPDGSRFAYAHYRRGSPSTTGIWIVDTAGVAPHQILSGEWAYPDWSPDGTLLAISKVGIYSVKPTGDSLRAITTKGLRPRWSPAGNELAFESFDTTGTGSIWLVSRDGTGLRSLAPTGGQSWWEPDWSPDGTRLVHVRRLSISSGDEIFVMDTTGHAEQQLRPDPLLNSAPAWSPDGQWIAWSRREDGGMIWLIKPDGTEAHSLTPGEEPSWSPDSRRIVFTRLTYNIIRLYAIDIATLRVRQITQ
jgi:TolB protein